MAENTFELKVITPERTFFDEQVDMVEFNTTEGEIGIYKNHVPTTVIVKPGVLTITQNGATKEAALHAGFVEILPNSVTILAEVIEWPDEIDVSRAESARDRAKKRIEAKETGTDILRAETALLRSIARLNVVK